MLIHVKKIKRYPFLVYDAFSTTKRFDNENIFCSIHIKRKPTDTAFKCRSEYKISTV